MAAARKLASNESTTDLLHEYGGVQYSALKYTTVQNRKVNRPTDRFIAEERGEPLATGVECTGTGVECTLTWVEF